MQPLNQNIFWLNEKIALNNQNIIGEKAANLANLLQSGYAVPNGFCIPNELLLSLSANPEVERLIKEAYHQLLEQSSFSKSVAVRSSSTREDLENASFAGQFESILNISSEKELLKAIKTCFQAENSQRLAQYQKKHGVEDQGGHLAILVQLMVSAEFSGVLFTQDPISSTKNKMVIEMTPGLGNEITSGQIKPVQFFISPDSTIIEKNNSQNGFIKELQKNNREFFDQLYSLGKKLEEHFKNPQDIEWAYKNQQIWVLQSRPITTKKQKIRHIWSRANAAEILPNIVTPLTWSVFTPLLQSAGKFKSLLPWSIHWNWTPPGGNWPESHRLIQGRAYMELASVYASFASLPGIDAAILQKVLGFEYYMLREDEFPQRLPRNKFMDIPRRLSYWFEILGIIRIFPILSDFFIRQSQNQVKRIEKKIENSEFEEILKIIERIQKKTAPIFGCHLFCTNFLFSLIGLIEEKISEVLPEEKVLEFETSLTLNLQNISTFEQSKAIWKLKEIVLKKDCTQEALIKEKNPLQTWQNCPDAKELIRFWNSFIKKFGMRGLEEFELSQPHWVENPVLIFDNIRNIIKLNSPPPQTKTSDFIKKRAAEILLEVQNKSSFLDFLYLKRLIKYYNRLVPYRENLKYGVVTYFYLLRQAYLKLGKQLYHKKILEKPEDIFFAEQSEIFNKNILEKNFLKTIAFRKEKHQKYSSLPAPDFWVQTEDGETALNNLEINQTDTIQGIACSPGVVTAKAYLLNSKDNSGNIPPDCILVADSIDPGQTIHFINIKGLITEFGGLLSHGAIVAREFGLPAVTGITRATKIIKNGQEIVLDGYTGKIYLEKKGEEND